MLRTILLSTLMAMGSAIATVQAEDKPADDKSTLVTPAPAEQAATTTPSKVETRDVANFFDESFNDMPDELKTAKDDGKKGLLIMFEMDECPFCHRMKNTVLNRSDIQDYYKANFHIITVDIEGDVELTNFKGEKTTQKDFALKEFRVRATPVFQFIGLDGEPIKNGRITGATKDAEEFLLFGQYIADRKNEEVPFAKFKREAGDTSGKPADAKS